MGHLHRRRHARPQERPLPVRQERLCRRAHRHAEKPPVRRREIQPADAPAQGADAAPADPQRQRRGGVSGRPRLRQRQAALLPRRLQPVCRPRHAPAGAGEPESVPQPPHQPRSDGGPPAGRVLRAPALGRVFPQGRLRPVVGAVRSRNEVPSQLPRPEPQQRMVLRHRQARAGGHAAAADQGALRRADHTAHLQQHARQPRRERRVRPQRDAAALPQRPQRGGERRGHRRAPLPRHVLRLPLEHHARPARHDQHRRLRPARRGPRRRHRHRAGKGRLA